MKSDVPLRICIKRVVEAKQNQELWERSYTKPGESMQTAPAQTKQRNPMFRSAFT